MFADGDLSVYLLPWSAMYKIFLNHLVLLLHSQFVAQIYVMCRGQDLQNRLEITCLFLPSQTPGKVLIWRIMVHTLSNN